VPIEPVLREYRREIRRVEPPATLEGGDVLRIRRRLLVGLSCRTNAAGVAALADIVRPFGYTVEAVPVRGCLHLKTACAALDERTLIVNPPWLDVNDLPPGFREVAVPDEEPWAANVLPVGGSILLAAGQHRTADLIRRLGLDVRPVDISEFAKAEGGVTCLSILV
jgi:dimethylargininase